jgi:hypothetical protein
VAPATRSRSSTVCNDLHRRQEKFVKTHGRRLGNHAPDAERRNATRSSLARSGLATVLRVCVCLFGGERQNVI